MDLAKPLVPTNVLPDNAVAPAMVTKYAATMTAIPALNGAMAKRAVGTRPAVMVIVVPNANLKPVPKWAMNAANGMMVAAV